MPLPGRRLRHFLVICLATVLAVPAEGQAQRRGSGLSIIRDAEIEHTLRRLAEPVFEASGLDPDSVSITLINSNTINAFVAGGQNMFLHTGLIQAMDGPEQLIGVMAHESGHLAGGHLIRGRQAREDASAQVILSTLLGIGAALLTGRGDAGVAIGASGYDLAVRDFLSFSRAQESAADQAALAYLDRTGLSARGLLSFFEVLENQELLPASQQVEYLRTHPLTRDRIRAVRAHVERSRHSDKSAPPQQQEQFQRMHAKLEGYLAPVRALRRFGVDDPTIAARYGRAIALYRRGDLGAALSAIDALVAQEPNNPFFHELKAQVLFENGRIAQAVPEYERTVRLLPDNGLLRMALARAVLEYRDRDPAGLDEAIGHLQVALQQERRSPQVWRLFATAYGRRGDRGLTAYALAEEAVLRGDIALAKQQAERAQQLLPRGSPAWLRAEDILGLRDPNR